jgi:hypothetical protein
MVKSIFSKDDQSVYLVTIGELPWCLCRQNGNDFSIKTFNLLECSKLNAFNEITFTKFDKKMLNVNRLKTLNQLN